VLLCPACAPKLPGFDPDLSPATGRRPDGRVPGDTATDQERNRGKACDFDVSKMWCRPLIRAE